MIDDFGYLNARIRVRRSHLIPEAFFWEALNRSFPELVKALGESTYGPELTGDSLADVDRAVAVHMSRTVADLPRLVSGKAREALTLLLMQADLSNVKTILRGKRSGWSAEEIKARLGGGTLPQGLYGSMSEASDAASLAQVISLSNPVLAAALREASRAGHDLAETELSLDRIFYGAALDRAVEIDLPPLADFIRFEIDASNLSNSIKLSTVGFEGLPDRFFVKGGRIIDLSLFRRLAGGELGALQELSGTRFSRVAEARDLPGLERELRCALLAKAHEEASDVLGVGLAIDYIQRKEWEGSRIRLLARRAYYNLPSALVEKEVFCR